MLDPDIFDRAADIVDAGWTQRATARDVDGTPVNALRDSAVCFCMQGAVIRALGNYELEAFYWKLMKRHSPKPVAFNDADGRTAAEVSAELRRVGQEVRKEQA